MATDSILAPGFATHPYWWEAAPPSTRASDVSGHHADVVIVGGGIAGLSAAIELARNGAKPMVLDAEAIGWGASSRNGGSLVGALALRRAKDIDPAVLAEMVSEADQAFEDLEQFVARENLQCDYRRSGRFHAAHAPSAMAGLAEQAAAAERLGGATARLLSKAEVSEELATDRYYGGLMLSRAGLLHPGKYVAELARVAAASGASLHGGVAVQAIQKNGTGGFRLRTTAGDVAADAVVLTTNAYTKSVTPWHRRRLVSVRSGMIATEELGAERVRALFPKLRAYGDTKRLGYYFRASPDGKRVLFGGRVQLGEPRHVAKVLHGFLAKLFPTLASARVTHAWSGKMAFAFDYTPHVGQHDGIHHAMACNGAGVVIMSHLGKQVARQVLGRQNNPSAFARLPFPTTPGYTGYPWFMLGIVEWYRLRDRMQGWP